MSASSLGDHAIGLPADEPSDEELVRRCVRRDERAWRLLVERYHRLVHAIAARAGMEPESTEEIFQETFSRLADRIQEIQHRGRVRAWIVTTARHLTIDVIRARIRERRFRDSVIRLQGLMPRDNELPSEEIERIEQQDLVRRALERLDDRSRRLLRLLFSESDHGLTYAGIAKELRMPVGSLGPTRARCLQKLRTEYEKIATQAQREDASVARCA